MSTPFAYLISSIPIQPRLFTRDFTVLHLEARLHSKNTPSVFSDMPRGVHTPYDSSNPFGGCGTECQRGYKSLYNRVYEQGVAPASGDQRQFELVMPTPRTDSDGDNGSACSYVKLRKSVHVYA